MVTKFYLWFLFLHSYKSHCTNHAGIVMSTGKARYGSVMLRALWRMLRDFSEHGGPRQRNILHILFLLSETLLPSPDLNLFSYHGYPSHLLVTPRVERMSPVL